MTIPVASAPCVHHASEVEESLVSRNVSDVAQPLLVWSVCGEVALKKIWRRRMRVRTLRRYWTVLSHIFRSDSALLHDSRDRVAMRGETKFRKFVRDLLITFRQNSSLFLLLRLSNCCRFSKTNSLIGACWMSTYPEELESTDPKFFLEES